MPSAVRHFYEFGQFRLDADKRRLLREGQLVPLSPKAVEALFVLVRNPGKPLEREVLMQAVWADSFVEDANLTVAISHLRKALGQNNEAAEYIETVPRVGYRFVADVREIREEPAPLIVEKRTLSRTVIEEEFVPDGPGAHEERDVSVPRRLVTRPVPAFLHQHATASSVVLIAAALALGAIFYLRANKPTSPGAITSIRSVAVLPPRSLSGKAEDAPLSLGVADA